MSKRQASSRSYYEILNSTPNATFEVLKSNYKQLILQSHPDKLQQDEIEATAGAGDVADPNIGRLSTEFVIINEAWNTLKDPVKRKHYDAELLLSKFQTHSNIFERLTLDDMTRIENEGGGDGDGDGEDNVETFYTYSCRCGGQYIIDESAARDNGIYAGTNKRAPHTDDCTQQRQQQFIDDNDKTAADTEVDADGEVMVECNECSLVIILSNAPKCTPSS